MSRLRIAHLSDPHFGTIHHGVEPALHAALATLKPDLILLTGDITQRARAREFRAAREFVARLRPTPVVAVPGNHDIPLWNLPVRLFNPYGQYTRFRRELEKDKIFGDIEVISLNSTSRWRHVQGSLSSRHLRKALKAGRQAKIRVMALHHPLDCSKPIDEKNLLKGAHETMRVLDEECIDIVVGGHIHDPYVSLSSVRYPQIERPMILSVAGTCLSWRTRKGAPNSFNFIEVSTSPSEWITIERFDHSATDGFTAIRRHEFQRNPANQGWLPR